MRARSFPPNHVRPHLTSPPPRITTILVNYMNPTPFDDQVAPVQVNTADNQHGFPMRDFQLWYTDPYYDQVR